MNALRLVLASANPHKVTEIGDILGASVELLPRPADLPEVIEDAPSLEGNARLKAWSVALATGMPAVADDTGLEVDALDGAPGVHTARYAGASSTDAENRAKLLADLSAAGARPPRVARFRTVALIAWPSGAELVANGACEGTIAVNQRGDAGFGYDALFVPAEGDGRTFAEMTDREKHTISHRGRAFRALLDELINRPPRRDAR